MAEQIRSAGALERPRRVFRFPLSDKLLSTFGLAVIVCLAILLTGATVWLALQLSWIALAIAPDAAIVIGLALYCRRDFSGKWGLKVVLDASSATFDLPSGRSLIHRPPPFHRTVPYADIVAIDTRLEAYGSLGMEIMQRAYAMHLKGGELVFLFEDRALATSLGSELFGDLAADLAARVGVEVEDLGMAEGKGGLLAVWGAHAPDWAAPALSAARAEKLWGRARVTGALAITTAAAATSGWYGGLLRERR